ncbi:hypothetical protein H5410_021201 [Solanum commersonii]|uniref:DUF1985 domain-containing protein n=1 Tax=Solanum commersonii TaxID=4109 RepID=A0A9J5ZDK0_SOLCO|nr:hypothetical protein H5410_021201 [Solanum commersonii]
MDTQSPSKTFTRGIHLHGENSVEQLSFFLGLTQNFGEVASSMSKSNAMQEIKSKLKNDPIRLEEMSAKLKQSNIRIVEGDDNAKRKEVVVSGSLEHGEAVKFLGKREPTSTPHMQCYTNIEVMNVICRCHVQAQLIRCMFLREIEDISKNAILIHINGTTLRFTIRDYAIIAGLKCSDNENDFVFNTEEPNMIILQYFGVGKAITKKQLIDNFSNKVWGDNDDDAVKFAILFYIHSFILSKEPTITVIDRKDFALVESGKYIDYPWSKKAFDLLILHLHNEIKHDGKYNWLYGFSLALKLIFQNLSPTPMELKILELPPEYVQSNQSPTEISAVNDSDDDFQDPPHPKNNKGKEKVDTCSSPPKKVISKQPCLRKSPRHANVPKRPKSPLLKRQAKQCGNGDGVEVTHKVPTISVDQSEEPSRHSPSELSCQSIYNDLNDQEVHNNFEVPITFEVQNTSEFSNISEVQNTSEKEDCQDVPIEVNKEGSQFMNDQADFNNSSFMVHDDQSNLNPERSMVLHPLLAVDEHTPLPIPRERRLGSFNTSPYVTLFGS